jgi:hypothetical protein
MSRERARTRPPPAGSRRYGGGAEEPAPVPVGVTGHQTQNPAAQGPSWKLGPPDHTQPNPAPHWALDPGGERRPISPPLAPLIAQLAYGGLLGGSVL